MLDANGQDPTRTDYTGIDADSLSAAEIAALRAAMRSKTGGKAVRRKSDGVRSTATPVLAAGEPGTAGAPQARRGRGAATNDAGRFEAEARMPVDDGWGDDEPLPPLKTTVQEEKARTIITRNDSPDLPFDRSVNPYRGCEHGCVYCFARPTHAYVGLSAGLDFETKLFSKPNAAALLEREISAPGYKMKPIAMGTNTDPYQPVERELRITRSVLEVLARANHPVMITTKGGLVQRDIDLLAPMAEKGLVKVALSVTTLDRKLARAMEPRAATPQKRLDTIRVLGEAGIPVGVLVSPMIPALNDSELETILAAAYDHGAREAGYIMLRLPLEVSELFRDFLLRHYPDRYRHVMVLVRSMRDGKDYDADYARRMTGGGPYAEQLAKRFEIATRKIGFNKARSRLNETLFVPPRSSGVQLQLF